MRTISVELDDEQTHSITLQHLKDTYQIHYDFENDEEDPELDKALRMTLGYFMTPNQYDAYIKSVESTRRK